MSDDIDRLNSLYERRDVKTPHCKLCGHEMNLTVQNALSVESFNNYWCGNPDCTWFNLYAATWDDKPRAHAVHGEAIFKEKK